MMEEFESEPKKAQFNSAIAILYRIDALWQAVHRAVMNSEFIKWNFFLDRIWQELVADAKPEETTFLNKLDNKIKELYSKNALKESIYRSLLLKEAFIRTVQNQQGKGEAYGEGHEAYMDG